MYFGDDMGDNFPQVAGGKASSRGREQQEMVGWKPPRADWSKLNFDGAVSKDGKAAVGGVLRKSSGMPMCLYACQIFESSVFKVELLALIVGIKLASRLGIEFLEVEGDAMQVINAITNRETNPWQATAIVKDAKQMLREFQQVEVKHVKLDGNRVADEMAKMGLSTGSEIMWTDQYPSNIDELLQHDCKTF